GRRGRRRCGATRAVGSRGRRLRQRRLLTRERERLVEHAADQLVEPGILPLVALLVERRQQGANLGRRGGVLRIRVAERNGAGVGVDDAVECVVNLIQQDIALVRRILALTLRLVLVSQLLHVAVVDGVADEFAGGWFLR